MTFDEFWQDTVSRGTADTAANRTAAMAAWDTAVCAASACCLGGIGRLREPGQIHTAIYRLHTWHTPAAPEALKPEL